LSGDIDGDGAADFTVDATTDGSGGYLFDGLPAGSYSIVVDVNTVPPQYRQTFDPDGTLDSQTQLTLGAGENNLDQDFGYATPLIPELPRPPVPPVLPPVPPVSPETGIPEPGDPMLGYQFSESAADRIVFPVERTNDMQQQPVPITPLFSGRAEPGTTLHLILSDAEGNTLGYETIIADPGGSWIGGFTNTILADGIYEMEVIQTVAAYNNSSQGFYNLRTYFNPAFIGMHYSSTVFDTGAVFSSTAEIILQAMHQSNRSLLDLDWDEFSGYEFFSPSINQSQHKR